MLKALRILKKAIFGNFLEPGIDSINCNKFPHKLITVTVLLLQVNLAYLGVP